MKNIMYDDASFHRSSPIGDAVHLVLQLTMPLIAIYLVASAFAPIVFLLLSLTGQDCGITGIWLCSVPGCLFTWICWGRGGWRKIRKGRF